MNEIKPDIVVSAIGHDPQGTWARHFPVVNESLKSLFKQRIISFTERTSHDTINSANDCGWQVFVEEASISLARYRAVERGLNQGSGFVNLWDGDRLLHAATVAPDELEQFTRSIPNYDFLILGATPDARDTHPKSLTLWEGIKSWWLGHYLGIEGDIANRGCFGLSREFATFLLTYQLTDQDETDGLFPLLALAYQKVLKDEGQEGRGIGYLECPNIASYEDWIFEGLTQKESARRKTSTGDFLRRSAEVLRILRTADRIALMYELTLED